MPKKWIALICAAALCLALSAALGEGSDQPTPVPEATPTLEPTATPAVFPPMPVVTEKPAPTPRPTDAPLPEDPFLYHVVEISRRIGLLAESDKFMLHTIMVAAYWTTDYEHLTGGDHQLPQRMYSLDGAELVAALTGNGSVQIENVSAAVRNRMVNDLPQWLWGQWSEKEQQVLGTLARYKTFAMDLPESCGVYILLYQDAVPVMLTWYAENGAVCMSAWFMPDEALEKCASAADVSAWFVQKGMPAVNYKEVAWP